MTMPALSIHRTPSLMEMTVLYAVNDIEELWHFCIREAINVPTTLIFHWEQEDFTQDSTPDWFRGDGLYDMDQWKPVPCLLKGGNSFHYRNLVIYLP